MEQNLRKFSKILNVCAIVLFVLNSIWATIVIDYDKALIFALIVFVVAFVVLFLNIPSKIKTIIVATIIILPILSMFFATTQSYFRTMFFGSFPYFYPAFAILLVNSWLRELAHLDSPKQDKIDKLKKQLESLESDDKQE